MTYQVGRFYEVPCVRARYLRRTAWWPVMGPRHDDREHIRFPYVHWHVDWRFVPQAVADCWGESSVFDLPICAYMVIDPATGETFGSAYPLYGAALANGSAQRGAEAQIVARLDQGMEGWHERRRKRCRRADFPEYPSNARWMERLETAYRGESARTPGGKLVCPHRGMALDSVPADDYGCVTCPLHGLRWDARTGGLRTELRPPVKVDLRGKRSPHD